MYSKLISPVDVGALHERLYAGEIFLFEDLPAMQAVVQFTRAFLEEAFQPHAPPQVHHRLTREQQIDTFAALGKAFTRSAQAKRL